MPGDAPIDTEATGHLGDGADAPTAAAPLLSVSELETHIATDRGPVRAVDGVSFDVQRGETVCLVGESGSGKTVTCQSITGIVPRPPAEIVGGAVTFDGTAILDDEPRLRRIRGDRIGQVFQNPQHALDPVYTVGSQLVEAIRIHRDVDRSRARERAVDLLATVGIPEPRSRFEDHPHEFSGGMRQRIAIAIGLAAAPELLIADEPMTSVDVTVQARLIELFRELTRGGLSMLLVTHDLRVVAALADRVLVMYGGTIVERGAVADVFERPAHPYTQSLFESYDGLSRRDDHTARGDIPPDGCRFRRECPHAVRACSEPEQPAFREVGDGPTHSASCVYFDGDRDPGPILEAARDARPESAGTGATWGVSDRQRAGQRSQSPSDGGPADG